MGSALSGEGSRGSRGQAGTRAQARFLPPEVALHTVKIACELPEERGVPLGKWDCQEIAKQLVADLVVARISAETVRRILAGHQLRPWRTHAWLSPRVRRDAVFAAAAGEIADLYTRRLEAHEMVLCVDEKTSLQPRTRKAPTHAAKPGRPVRVEHEYRRAGALNLFAAFNTRDGQVIAETAPRKRAAEFCGFLDRLDREVPAHITTIHLILDNLRVHKGKAASSWLAAHPRFVFHFPPVHCSWMNQVEQWFSLLQRKALSVENFASLDALARRLLTWIARWNADAHPFNWTSASVAHVMARCAQAEATAAAA